jgi:hypothetical protein
MFDKLAYDRDESVKLFFFLETFTHYSFFFRGGGFCTQGLIRPKLFDRAIMRYIGRWKSFYISATRGGPMV